MKFSVEEFRAWENKRVTLVGMSGVGKSYLSAKLRGSHWFHYSGDYRIGTRYLDEHIIDMIKALSGPYKHTGVRFMPTGGVSADNLESYLGLDVIAAAGGTWIAKKDDMTTGAWGTIADRCRAAVDIVARARA